MLIGLVSCSDSDDAERIPEPLDINLTRSEAQVLKGVNKFAFDLMREVEKRRRENKEFPNFIISPQGAAWCLAMVANGVEPGSVSEKELFDVFGFENGESIQDLNVYGEKLIVALTSDKAAGTLHIADAVYYGDEISIYDDFLRILNTFYNTEEFPNQTNSQIDKWVSTQTKGAIPRFGTDINVRNALFGVLNTINFEGEWNKPFDSKLTKPREFHNEDGSISNPEMMCDEISGVYGFDDVCHTFKIGLKNKVFSIHFVLPAEGQNISKVIEHLDVNVWDTLNNLNNNSVSKARFVVRLPKFKLAGNYDLFEIAKGLGLNSFIDGVDMTRLCNCAEFEMTQFLRSSCMEIMETGVKVSSATNYSGNPLSAMPNDKTFYMDEPFCFFITEESTGAILFAGKIGQF